MIIKNAQIVTLTAVIKNGFLKVDNGLISEIKEGNYLGNEESIDAKGSIIFPGFIDVHMHGSAGIDFMDANANDYKKISESLYKEGVTTYLATTLTSDNEALKKVCLAVKEATKENPSLYGIHFEGPYISLKYKGAQNEAFIRNPNVAEFTALNELSGGLVRYISLAPEKDDAMKFIKEVTKNGVVCSAGHTEASFEIVGEAIENGLTNTTHTHNAMSPHHHRNPGVVTAAMYYNELFTEVICDKIHVCPDTLKAFYKIVGQDRFVMITDALKIKNSDINEFELCGLPCERKNGAAYLKTGPLAGSLLTMDQGLRNMKEVCNLSLCELAKITSTNAARCLHLKDRGSLEVGKLADFVIMNDKLEIEEVYKLGKKVF